MLYWAAVISFLASALAYQMALTYPLVLFVLDLWPLRRCRLQKEDLAACKRVFIEKVPFFLISALLLAIILCTGAFVPEEIGRRLFRSMNLACSRA